MNIEYDLDFAFRYDWRLEGALDGGIDGKDYALRRGQVLDLLGDVCATCGKSFTVGGEIYFVVFGYEMRDIRKIPYHRFCIPEQWQSWKPKR